MYNMRTLRRPAYVDLRKLCRPYIKLATHVARCATVANCHSIPVLALCTGSGRPHSGRSTCVGA
eukprot:14384337-Heterocapsa_arctica.AAC.1